MRILMCHNYYQQPGGEDQVFADEMALLRSRGDQVIEFRLHNDVIDGMGRARLAARTLWNGQAYARIRALAGNFRPQVVHFHNTFPLISPAAYYAARRAGAAVVQTLHNYRLLCPAAPLFRKGQVCEACLGRSVAWPGVLRGCYRDSRAASAVVAAMLAAHRLAGTWRRAVDRYIALTEFGRRKFIAGGLPAEKIAIKPNFVWPDPGPGRGGGGYALFIGRLGPEKGLATLLSAWRELGATVPLKIVGDGPLAPLVREAQRQVPGVQWLGPRPWREAMDLLGEAAVLVFCSACYEGMPKTVVEAFAKGTPVIAGRLGAMQQLIQDGETGLHFRPGDAGDLAAAVRWLLGNPALLQRMRSAARQTFETLYSADANYRMLRQCYEQAIAQRRNGRLGDDLPRPETPGAAESLKATVEIAHECDHHSNAAGASVAAGATFAG